MKITLTHNVYFHKHRFASLKMNLYLKFELDLQCCLFFLFFYSRSFFFSSFLIKLTTISKAIWKHFVFNIDLIIFFMKWWTHEKAPCQVPSQVYYNDRQKKWKIRDLIRNTNACEHIIGIESLIVLLLFHLLILFEVHIYLASKTSKKYIHDFGRFFLIRFP